jgi:hypothetical protein
MTGFLPTWNWCRGTIAPNQDGTNPVARLKRINLTYVSKRGKSNNRNHSTAFEQGEGSVAIEFQVEAKESLTKRRPESIFLENYSYPNEFIVVYQGTAWSTRERHFPKISIGKTFRAGSIRKT